MNTDIKVINQCHEDNFSIYHGDSCEVIKAIPTESVHLIVTSPPFPNMYVYNDSARDIGNNKSREDLLYHFGFLVEELNRVLKEGRECCIHLTQMPLFKGKDNMVGLMDFRGDVIRLFQEKDFIYFGEVCIDKNPQLKAIRTKEMSLLFKTLSQDSSNSRMAMADYVLFFKKKGENEIPIKAGINKKYNKDEGWITQEEWIRWARPVWYASDWNPNKGTIDQEDAINETDVLNVALGRDTDDEKHLAPLQLGVIKRLVKLKTNPGEIVLDPFNGIGSTGYQSILLNRKYIGIELKKSYYNATIKFMNQCLSNLDVNENDLFSMFQDCLT